VEPAIEVRDLGKSFPGDRLYPWRPPRPPTIALDHVSFEIRPREVFAIIGPNGAGKTTLLKILSTLLLPSSGSARILGHDVVAEEAWARACVALVTNTERSFYYRLSGWQNLRFFTSLYNMGRTELEARARPIARELGLTDAVLNRDYRTYSTGMQRKLQFLRAFVLDTPILFLDEPTSSLDPISAEEIRRTIATECRARDQTVFLSANNLLDVERLADRVAIIHRGRLEMIGAPSAAIESGTIRILIRGSAADARAALDEWTVRQPPGSAGSWKVDERAGGTLLRGEVSDPRPALTSVLEALWHRNLRVDQIDLRPFVLEEEFLRRVDAPSPDVPEAAPNG
jgi:ABC-2 type transport system ATP-binding protein